MLTPEKRRAERLRRLFDLTPQEYQKMADWQEGCCAICRRPPKRVPLGVDHCHRTGLIRGLTCLRCNRALALLGDDPERAHIAGDYLRFPPAPYALGDRRHGIKGRVTNKAATRKRLNRRAA